MENNGTNAVLSSIIDGTDKRFGGRKSLMVISEIYRGMETGEGFWEMLAQKETEEGPDRKKGRLINEDLLFRLFKKLPHSRLNAKKKMIDILFTGDYFLNIAHFDKFMEDLVYSDELSMYTMKSYEMKMCDTHQDTQIEIEFVE